MAERAQVGDDALRRRVGGAIGGGAGGALQGTHAVVGRIHVGELGQPDGAMGVQLQRLGADDGLDGRNQRLRALGRQQAAGILDIEGIDVGAGGQLARGRRRNAHRRGPGSG